MATRNPPVGGELVVEIYHDIYRVSITSSKRWSALGFLNDQR